MYPKSFEQVVGILLFVRVKLLHPFLGRFNYRGGITLAQLHPGTMAHAVHWVHQISKKLLYGLPVDFDRFLQRLLFVSKAVNPTMLFIAIRVSYIVLHVPDYNILPIGNIEGSILSENRIGRPKVLIPAKHKANGFLLYLGTTG